MCEWGITGYSQLWGGLKTNALFFFFSFFFALANTSLTWFNWRGRQHIYRRLPDSVPVLLHQPDPAVCPTAGGLTSLYQRTIAKLYFCLLMSEFYFSLFTQLDYFVSVSSIRAPYMGCMCGRFPRPVPEGRRIIKRWAAAAGQDPTGINSRNKECSVPRFPDQPGMLFEWIINSSRNQHWLAMTSGCQVSFFCLRMTSK